MIFRRTSRVDNSPMSEGIGPPTIFEMARRDLSNSSDTPQGQARWRLWNVLNSLGVDPVIVASGSHLIFVQLMCNLVQESKWDDEINAILEPLFAVVGEMNSQRAVEVVRAARQQVEADNLDAVLLALLLLDSQIGRTTVGVIRGIFDCAEPVVQMGQDTIRKHVKTISTQKMLD